MNQFILRATLLILVLTTSPLTSYPIAAEEDLAERMENAIALLRKSGSDEPQAIALMLNSAAEGYIQRGDFETALVRVQESLRLCREHGVDPTSPFITASKILTQSDDELATNFLLGELTAEGASTQYKKGVLSALDMHLALTGNLKLAVQAAWEKWQITKAENPGTEEEFWDMFKYGTHAINNQLYDVAGPIMREAQILAIQLGKPDLAANCSRALAGVLLAENRLEEALKLYDEGIAFHRNSKDPTAASFLGFDLQTKANVLMQLDRLNEAEEAIDEGSKLAKNEIEKGFYFALQAALAMKRELAKGGEPDLSDAIELQEKVVEEKLKNDVIGEEFAYLGATNDFVTLAAFQLLTGDLDGAADSLDSVDRGAKAWEANLRKAQDSAVFSADQVNLTMSTFRAAGSEFRQQLELRRGNPEAALVAAENGRGTAQAELMKSRMGLPPSDEVVKELSVDDIRTIAKEQDTTIVLYSLVHALAMDTRRFFARNHPLQSPRELYIWVVSPSGEINFAVEPLPGSIYELVELARQEVTKPPEQPLSPSPMRVLATLLIDSIEDKLPKEDGSLVTFVPQGQLFLVPFAALPTSDGRFLIDRHTIGLSPSIELLRLAAEQKKRVDERGKSDILLVGNPTMPGYQVRPDRDAQALSPLPGAEAEARYLSTILDAEPLIGDAANEAAVSARMEDARILHFATHGLLETETSYDQSFLSALAFAPSPGEDGFLTVRETARLDLAAELAVLSACDTGRGAITGDGVVGLSRGYITAGVPTVVVSLWPVSDEATAKLMGFYYEALDAGEGKAEALRSAVLKTRENWALPRPLPRPWRPSSPPWPWRLARSAVAASARLLACSRNASPIDSPRLRKTLCRQNTHTPTRDARCLSISRWFPRVITARTPKATRKMRRRRLLLRPTLFARSLKVGGVCKDDNSNSRAWCTRSIS
ncbi:MAG: CHAT domain-containing protein [Verrucomicrobiota bacterium]